MIIAPPPGAAAANLLLHSRHFRHPWRA